MYTLQSAQITFLLVHIRDTLVLREKTKRAMLNVLKIEP